MKKYLLGMALLGASVSGAAPADKLDPVASGFTVWEGVTEKNYLRGREITPSDLRHKVTVLIEIELNDKLGDQLEAASRLASRSSSSKLFGHSINWEEMEMPRDVMVVFSVRGEASAKMAEKLTEAFKNGRKAAKTIASAFSRIESLKCPFYQNLTFTGAPDTTGKRPYIYVFGPTGAEPICQGELAATVKDALAAIAKGKKELAAGTTWRPFFGSIAEPKYNTTLAKALEKSKKQKKAPLMSIEKALLADVKSSDAEKAKEAQILYDALQQTRSDLVFRIMMEAAACPHRAYHDAKILVKYWPAVVKQIDSVMARMKKYPQADMMGNIFSKLMTWGDSSFECKPSEAKKIIVELNKMKKSLAPLKEAKDITVQNGALLLDMRIDNLLPIFQAKSEQ